MNDAQTRSTENRFLLYKEKKEALLVIGLIHQGETHVFHFGDHPIQKRVQPEDVIFEIGSISKVFQDKYIGKHDAKRADETRNWIFFCIVLTFERITPFK
ncbi:hypothetical protein BSAF29S_04006 [Bacillus safensis subsp. safensis]